MQRLGNWGNTRIIQLRRQRRPRTTAQKAGEHKDYAAEKATEGKDKTVEKEEEYKDYTAEKTKEGRDTAVGKLSELKESAADAARA